MTRRLVFRLLAAVLGAALRFPAAEAADWHVEAGFRWRELFPPAGGHTGFTLLGPERTGVDFTNTLGELPAESNRVLSNGSGVAAGDFDGDGLPDLFFCGLEGRNVLYKNLGDFRFRDVTREAGINLTNLYCRGAVFADLNGDGRPDLLVAVTGEGVRCYLNDGHGGFVDQTDAAGLHSPYGAVSLALADVDGDGTLDLYVVNNRTDDIRDRGEVDLKSVNGRLTVPPELQNRLLAVGNHVLEYGDPSFLYLNDGRAHFSPVSWTNGAFVNDKGVRYGGPPLDWGLTAAFRDMNGDGWPDLYVCNDYWTPDRVWINDGSGHFKALDYRSLRNSSASSMGVDFADLDRTGNFDFLVVDMLSRDPAMRRRQMLAQTPVGLPVGVIDNRPQFMRNTLQVSRGDGTYAEIANFAGLAASDWAWCPLFLDVDLDGYEDVLITAGHYRDVQDLDAADRMKASQQPRTRAADPMQRREAFIRRKMENAKYYPRLDMPVAAFRNLGAYRFEEVTTAWGTDAVGVHHSLAAADFDGDGDVDFAVNNLGGAAGVYRNETSAPRVAVRLKGRAPNTQGVGARVTLLGGAVPMQDQEIVSGGRYMAGSDPQLTFAAGSARTGMTIHVAWRSGRTSEIPGVGANRAYEIEEPSGEPAPKAVPPGRLPPLFEEVSARLGHAAPEQAFDDFSRQPLLPRKLSQLGPAAVWADLDGDGYDDLILGAAKGDSLDCFRNDRHGGFSRSTNAAFTRVLARDASGMVAWPRADGSMVILAGASNYEDGRAEGAAVETLDPRAAAVASAIPAWASSVGPLALADVNGDGNLDLFVGGRVVPERYPEAASSLLLLGDGHDFHLDAANTRALEKVGLVSGAVWTDLDGDGFPELVLACEWGPLRVFQNNHGKLTEATEALGLAGLTGWWNGVTAGDFDGDGRLDIAASNWGLNSSYQASPAQPLRLYYGDLSDRGSVDVIETEYDPLRKQYEPRRLRDALLFSIPDLAERFPTHKAYSEASIEAVLGPRFGRARLAEAATLASTVLLNRAGRFEAAPLPREAQWAPAFAVCAADFDGDGREDLFLGQNFSPNQPEVPRSDAGRGLVLRGDGAGRFSAMSGPESGIFVYGDQRGAAVADFDADGRADLVVTQNGTETKLYHNQGARPGLRVRLQGPPGNPTGVGAVLRLRTGGRLGPAREIHAGSGYWSQDSPVQVLGYGDGPAPEAVWVRWPGGAVSETPAGGVREVLIRAPTAVRSQE